PADGNPPLSYLLVRVWMRLFGESEFGIRIPSILAFVWTAIAIYLFVARRCVPAAAMLSVFALCSGIICIYYCASSRPYSLLLGFTALTLLSWQRATEREGRRLLPLAGISLGIAGAIASHHYGVLHVGIPLAVGELVRLKQRRHLDLAVGAAGLVGL